VSPQTLLAKGVVSLVKGKLPAIKVLGTGECTKKLTLSGCLFSASVKAKIEKAGGQVIA
jgi:ribosomal protein L15